jgi:hypothetical protein
MSVEEAAADLSFLPLAWGSTPLDVPPAFLDLLPVAI